MKLAFFITFLILVSNLQAQIISPIDPINVQLVKKTFIGNDFTEVLEYKYNAQRKISKIIHTQDGKLHATTDSFNYNVKGNLTSYIKTYNLDISPEKTTIEYDSTTANIKRIEINRTQKTKEQNFVSSKNYVWYQDSVVVFDTVFAMGKNGQRMVYQFDVFRNITSLTVYNIFNKQTSKTDYFEYDKGLNINKYIRGYVDYGINSRNNAALVNYVDVYKIKSKYEYHKRQVSKYVPGGPKIPNQFIATNIILKKIETMYNKDAKKVIIVGITNFEYIGLPKS